MTTSENFDWVTERARCSIATVFAKMHREIIVDVKKRNEALPKGSSHQFEVRDEDAGFVVSHTIGGSNGFLREVIFSLDEEASAIVAAAYRGEEIFSATLTINNEGKCRLKIDGQ
jgi:hypothetical protein